MAIVQISRIQHRRGLREDLPNLSSAEFGWCVDTRQLFIGNGLLSEGAPSIGSTEVLTEYSDLFGKFGSYTYSGIDATSYAVVTGPSETSPIQRSLQQRLDEIVSVKSFGAKGDGSTDDTDAINRALYELYCREQTASVRRTLYFPAGVYLVSDVIKIPTYAKLLGDGKNSAIIRQTSDTVDYAFSLSDSKQQISSDIGNNAAITPRSILIQDMSFEATEPIDVFQIPLASGISFINVGFYGSQTEPDSFSEEANCISISSSGAITTSNIIFSRCSFSKNRHALKLLNDVENLLFTECDFSEFFRAIELGGASESPDARGVRITNCIFDFIFEHAIKVFTGVPPLVTGFNSFTRAGDQFTGVSAHPIVIYENNGNSSWGDYFDRSDATDIDFPRISHEGSKSIVLYPEELHIGEFRQRAGDLATLSANVTNTSTGISFDKTVDQMVMMNYSIASASEKFRMGKLSLNLLTLSVDDEFTESSDLGIEFSLSLATNTVTLLYTNSSSNTANFKYSIQYFRNTVPA